MNRRVCGLPKAICLSCTRTESRNVQNKTDKDLGFEGLRELLRSLPVEPPIVTASALVTAMEEFRGSTPCRDDQSVIVLQKTDGCLS
jgi:serine phosphatase RsbU (regulator of sigma subunit)